MLRLYLSPERDRRDSQALQDLIAPDVKSLTTDLAALKLSVDQQFIALRQSMAAKCEAAGALGQARYAALLAKTEAIRIEFASTEAAHAARHEAVLKALDIDKRRQTDRSPAGRTIGCLRSA